MKLQSEMVGERVNGFQTTNQLRDLMLSRISTFAGNLGKEDFLDTLITQVKERLASNAKTTKTPSTKEGDGSIPLSVEEVKVGVRESTGPTEDIKKFIRGQVHDALNGIVEETKIYALREENIMNNVRGKERRVEKDFLEFFNEAERQIMEYEKKIRSDQYGQMLTRLRAAEREIAIRDQVVYEITHNQCIKHVFLAK